MVKQKQKENNLPQEPIFLCMTAGSSPLDNSKGPNSLNKPMKPLAPGPPWNQKTNGASGFLFGKYLTKKEGRMSKIEQKTCPEITERASTFFFNRREKTATRIKR